MCTTQLFHSFLILVKVNLFSLKDYDFAHGSTLAERRKTWVYILVIEITFAAL